MSALGGCGAANKEGSMARKHIILIVDDEKNAREGLQWGLENDWRYRTRFCEAFREFYGYIERRLKELMPNLHPVPEFYPARPTAEMVQRSLRLGRGSSFRRYARTNTKRILEAREPAKKPAAGHGDSHGDSHGDRPHGDHLDGKR